jgi:SpoVK/Ycf46/Vps4 family AAA+-type ATPase
MRTGFTILLHGAPGTGKTETVMQLALKTKRDVMRVDLSQTKSMWYGESEKKIKKIFDQYREVLKYADHVPILLFNEADGLFGIRTSQEKSNTSQTFNTMQNILLEEMENFEGILIATTNLTANFDKAFERRFLYKIAFSPPAETARKMIWRSKLPEIPKNITGKLAVEFPFSGGQIENIARKCEIDGLLNGRQPGERELRNHCLEEKLNQPQRVKVGFRKTA